MVCSYNEVLKIILCIFFFYFGRNYHNPHLGQVHYFLFLEGGSAGTDTPIWNFAPKSWGKDWINPQSGLQHSYQDKISCVFPVISLCCNIH